MTDINNEFGGVWPGVSTLVVAVLAISVFVFTTEPINIGGVIAGLALALIGLGQVLAPRVSPWFERLSHRWVGLCWVLVGGAIAALGLVASSTIDRAGGGLVLGALFILYGGFVALGR